MMQYLLNSALMLACCLCFYKIFLQKETFYRLNRFVLGCCLVLSFGLPLIPVPQVLSLRDNDENIADVIQRNAPALLTDLPEKPVVKTEALNDPSWAKRDPWYIGNYATDPDNTSAVAAIPATAQKISFTTKLLKGLMYLYWFGVGAFLLNFLIQLILLLRKAYTLPFIQDGKFRIVEVPGDEAPSSFGKIIFINPEKYEWETYNQILQHEKIHIEQQHSIDIVLSELVIAFQWFNPFAWMYRKEVETNLEYLTDDQMIRAAEVERTSYQLSILKVAAPRMPLSLTMNYNQSLIKKRIAMMNAKRSNLNTTWKYIFMFPLLFVLMNLLNEPMVFSQTKSGSVVEVKKDGSGEVREERTGGNGVIEERKGSAKSGIADEGSWFATTKGDKIQIQFKSDEDENSTNMSSFKLSEFTGFKSDGEVEFSLKREAGTMNFKGKFEDGNGMGHYKFEEDKSYKMAMEKEGVVLNEPWDMKVMFFIDAQLSYVRMLKKNGYNNITKNEIIPMASMKIDEQYISFWKKIGYNEIAIQDLIALHSLKVTEAYVKEIRSAGFGNVTPQELITFKAQGIDGKYIAKLREANNENLEFRDRKEKLMADDIFAMKAMEIDPEYVKALKSAGYTNIQPQVLIGLKSQVVTPEYIKTFNSLGLGKIEANDLLVLKSMDVTPAYVKEIQSMGYTNLNPGEIGAAKSMGVNSAYLKEFKDLGLSIPSLTELMMMKSQNIDAKLFRDYKKLGFDNTPPGEIMSAYTMGVTPQFVIEMRAKGHNLKSLQKYAMLKNALSNEEN